MTVTASPQGYNSVPNPYHYEGVVAEDGTWAADLVFSGNAFVTGGELTITTSLRIDSLGLAYNISKTKGLYCLVTGRRLFDGSGQYLGDSGALLSTRLDDLGIPVESEEYRVPHAIFGSDRSSPVTSYVTLVPGQLRVDEAAGTIEAEFKNIIPVDDEIPPGHYKIRLDFGIEVSPTMRITLAGTDPASVDAYDAGQSYIESRLIDFNSGESPRMIWTLFSQFHPGGGALALEDKGLAALSRRMGSFEKCLVPLKDQYGRQVRYLLEPDFPGELNPFLRRDIPTLGVDYTHGSVSLRIKNPNGTIIDCGAASFIGPRGLGATTGSDSFFFSFSQYGKHLIECKGWLTDKYGTVYRGGGVYEVWVAQPLLVVPSTPPGRPIATDELYNSACHIYPPLAADIEILQELNKFGRGGVESNYHHVAANRFGQFIPSAGDARNRITRSGIIRFKNPGMYRIHYLAEFKEKDGTIWMGQFDSFGVVYDPETPGEAYGTMASEAVLPFPDANKTSGQAFRIEYPLNQDEIALLPEDNFSCFDPVIAFKPALYGSIFRGDEDVLVSVGEMSGLRSGAGAHYPPVSYPEYVNRDGFQCFSSVRSDGLFQMALGEISPDTLTHPLQNPFNAGELPRNEQGDYYIFNGGLNFGDLQGEAFLQLPYMTSAYVTGDYAKPTYYPGGEIEISSQLFPRKIFSAFPAIYPGDILRKGQAYIIDCIAMPCSPADFEIAVTYPDSSVRRAHGSSSKYGIIGGPELWFDLGDPGVYRVSYTLFRGDETGYPLGTSEDSEGAFNIYVIDGGYSNRIDFHLDRTTPIDPSSGFQLRGDVSDVGIVGGRASMSITFQGSLVEEQTIDISDGLFAFTLDPVAVNGVYPNYSANDPNDRLDINIFVMGLTPGGKVSYAAEKLYTMGPFIHAVPISYPGIKAEDRRVRVEKNQREEKGREYRSNRGLRS